MESQSPADGILKRHDWGNSKVYQVVCQCGQPDHDHQLWVEADNSGINVELHVTVKSDFWSEAVKPKYDIEHDWLQEFDWFWKGLVNGFWTRTKLTWTLWTKGYVQQETCLSISKQVALNYADVLKSAVTDCEQFEKERVEKLQTPTN